MMKYLITLSLSLFSTLATGQRPEILKPLQTSDSVDVYQIYGAEIKTHADSKVIRNTGPDFKVTYFVFAEGDSVGIYWGRHPDVPHFCSIATQHRWRESKVNYLKKAAQNNGHFIRKEEWISSIRNENDSIVGTKKDSMVWELYLKVDRNFWITRPLINQPGQIDIIVEFDSKESGYFN
ncbi:MAG: hypothetical protein AAGC47_04795, partial [Bacteroidota bacterium]